MGHRHESFFRIGRDAIPSVMTDCRAKARHKLVAALGALFILTNLSSVAETQAIVLGVANVQADNRGEIRRVASFGVSIIHRNVRWEEIAPMHLPARWRPWDHSDPNYNWVDLDNWVIAARRNHLEPMLTLDGAPHWAERCALPPTLPTQTVCDPDPQEMAPFVRAAAERYNGENGLPRVKLWQIRNEPNLGLFYFPQFTGAGRIVSAAHYREHLLMAYPRIKAANQTNLLIAAGLAPIGRPGVTVSPMIFLKELFCMRGRDRRFPVEKTGCEKPVRLDAIDIHPYTTGGPTRKARNPNDIQLGDLQRLVAAVEKLGKRRRIAGRRGKIPVWITEMAWDSNPPDPNGLKPRVLNRWTAHAIYAAWAAGVRTFMWHSLYDQVPVHGQTFGDTFQAGLIYGDDARKKGTNKPHVAALRFPFVAFPRRNGRRLYIWGILPKGERAAVLEGRFKRRWIRVRRFEPGKRESVISRVIHMPKRPRFLAVRLRTRSATSLGFALKEQPDFYHPPFG